MRMNVIIYLIFAGSLPPPLSVLQVNQYSRPHSESSPFIFRPSPFQPPRRRPLSRECAPLRLSPPPSPLSLCLSSSPTLKVHRHYFRRNQRAGMGGRIGGEGGGGFFWNDKKQQRLLKIEENPPPADMDFINSSGSFSRRFE